MFVCPSACPCGYPSVVRRPTGHPAVRPVWLSVRLSARLKCFADPQTLMLPTLLNAPGIRKQFNSPLHFKRSALGIITNFELKALIVYQNVPADRSSTRPSARPPARTPALPSIRSALARRIATRPLARPPARPTVNQTKQYLFDWPPAIYLHAKQPTSTIYTLLYSIHTCKTINTLTVF